MDRSQSSSAYVQGENRVRKPNRATAAAKFNATFLNTLQKGLQKNPELDLTSIVNNGYSKKLASFMAIPLSGKSTQTPVVSRLNYDLRSRLEPNEPTNIIRGLSSELQKKLGKPSNLSTAIVKAVMQGDVLHAMPSVTVVKIGTIAVKITMDVKAVTELGSLDYLQKHCSTFPAPSAHGLLKMGIYYILFTDFIPGITLEEAWPRLDVAGKRAVQAQLEEIFSQLRSLPFQSGVPLGCVSGEGCKDIRRTQLASSEVITTTKQFEDFIFSGSRAASAFYTQFLRKFMPKEASCVFTHGDLRPANIIVGLDSTSKIYKIQGIIDWEASGFYPSYWESVKATNNLTQRENCDWYNYLPRSVSPYTYCIPWLVDRVWDRSRDNS